MPTKRSTRRRPTRPRPLALARVYELLEPGPVVLLTTMAGDQPNVMTLSWHMMVDFEPPLVACVVSRNNFSYAALRRTKECVIAIPAAELARKVVGIGNVSGAKVDKFRVYGLTPLPAESVAAPLVAECFANLECRIVDTRLVRDYDLFVLEVVGAWRSGAKSTPITLHHNGRGHFSLDGHRFQLPSRKL